MLRRLSPLADSLILARPESERSLAPALILPIAAQYHRRVVIIERPEKALFRALAAAAPEDLICVTGSLYLIGAAKRFFSERCGTQCVR
jgi:dihydrofolate synthase / folylpolyglutamate synthase